jgi:hypothetical protein
MKQHTLAMAADKGFEQYHRPTKRDVFLKTMDQIVPWAGAVLGGGAVLSERTRRQADDRVGAHGAHVVCAALVQPG